MSSARLSRVVVTFALSVLCAGCGKKGALYLPDHPRPAEESSTSAPAAGNSQPSLPTAPSAP